MTTDVDTRLIAAAEALERAARALEAAAMAAVNPPQGDGGQTPAATEPPGRVLPRRQRAA